MNDISNKIPQPDPAWDYYIVWHSLHHIKSKIDEALETMIHIENAAPEIDKEIKKSLATASDKLIEIVKLLPDKITA